MSNDFYQVVIIEDDPMVQEVNRQFVEQVESFRVVGVASNGADGIKMVKEMCPDLVIMDIYMPVKDGVETIKQLRIENEPVDVIVITAAKDKDTLQLMLRNGAIDYIIKPFRFDRIKHSLEKYRLYRSQLNKEGNVSQKELDQILHGKKVDTVFSEELLPKGLNSVTLNQVILLLLDQKDSLSSEEVAEKVGIARVTARRYLEYLEKSGRVSRDVRYGGVGRPMNRYQFTHER